MTVFLLRALAIVLAFSSVSLGCGDNRAPDNRCGDGVILDVEDCDDGELNSDQTPNACRSDCRLARCGDGTLDADEGCDDGNSEDGDACRLSCVSATCGDGQVQNGVEQCDAGSGNNDALPDACRTNCELPRCGDNVPDAGELCDDGNVSSQDDCLASCVPASCGDGQVHQGIEQCDDDNSDDTDSCLTTCNLVAATAS